MKNRSSKTNNLHQTGVIYQFNCPLPHSRAETYIGMTQATITNRLINHTQSGSIFKHFKQYHNSRLTRELLVENTTIIAKADNRYTLAVKEALLILNVEPSINKQFDNMSNILKLYNQRKSNVHPDISLTLVSSVHISSPPHSPILSRTNQHPINSWCGKRSLNNINNNTIASDTNDSIPDMSTILANFGVNTSFRELDLDCYLALVFEEENLSIGHRVKSRARTAHKKYM